MSKSFGPGAQEIGQTIQKYLCYQDADIPHEQKERALADSLAQETPRKYATALLALFRQHGEEAVLATARDLHSECHTLLGILGIESSPFGNSISWAMWDIGKQAHFHRHPQLADKHYPPRDPMGDAEVRTEIVNRHLGWEVHAAYLTERVTLDALQLQVPPRNWEACLELLAAPTKPDSFSLPSWQLSQLGALLRPESGPDTSWAGDAFIIS